jgi:hypothetical protein
MRGRSLRHHKFGLGERRRVASETPPCRGAVAPTSAGSSLLAPRGAGVVLVGRVALDRAVTPAPCSPGEEQSSQGSQRGGVRGLLRWRRTECGEPGRGCNHAPRVTCVVLVRMVPRTVPATPASAADHGVWAARWAEAVPRRAVARQALDSSAGFQASASVADVTALRADRLPMPPPRTLACDLRGKATSPGEVRCTCDNRVCL